jgi:hypothetical protein
MIDRPGGSSAAIRINGLAATGVFASRARQHGLASYRIFGTGELARRHHALMAMDRRRCTGQIDLIAAGVLCGSVGRPRPFGTFAFTDH